MATKKCPFCAEEIDVAAIKCKHCGSLLSAGDTHNPRAQNVALDARVSFGGTRKQISASVPPRDPLLMALLSGCCLAGLGQITLGQVKKGVIIAVLTVLSSIPTFGLSAVILFPLFAIDAYRIARKLKAGRTVDEFEFF